MTIFMCKQDYRESQREPTSSFRCHAICRRLCGTASQESNWYGAHYWAACALLHRPGVDEKREIEQYKRSFAINLSKGYKYDLPANYAKLWKLALKRVKSIRRQALRLKNSNLW